MRIIQDFTEEELRKLLDEFYSYFQNGFEFEEFLKPFLESIGLVEVFATKNIEGYEPYLSLNYNNQAHNTHFYHSENNQAI